MLLYILLCDLADVLVPLGYKSLQPISLCVLSLRGGTYQDPGLRRPRPRQLHLEAPPHLRGPHQLQLRRGHRQHQGQDGQR